jgi:5-hydroxyisourate hydrolase-like protein (transthyretin family)
MKQAEISGKVFLLLEEEREPRPAKKLTIELRSPDDQTRIFQTKTDDEGRYVLPNLEVGFYRLRVGTLRLELKVEEFITAASNILVPKTILVYIPPSLAR